MGEFIIRNPLREIVLQQGYAVLDGGLATELEMRGANLNDPMWSAKLLQEAPDLIEQVSYDYLSAGADIATTATYQATLPGFIAKGFTSKQAGTLLQDGVRITARARDRFWREGKRRAGRFKPLVAASIGPYGAYLHDGSEYRGEYQLNKDQLKDFHRDRVEILLQAQPDILAFETLPSLLEAEAVCELLSKYSNVGAWLSFSCRDEFLISDGTSIQTALRALEHHPEVVAIGFNCIAPRLAEPLLRAAAAVTNKTLIVYPNSGAGYNAALKQWDTQDDYESFTSAVPDWFESGARIIGGCCRTTPATIQAIRATLADFTSPKT